MKAEPTRPHASRRILTAAMIVASVTLGVSIAAAQDADPAVDPAISDEQGRILYNRHGCSDCHEADGAGALGPALVGNTAIRSDRYVVGRILTGGGDMPPFDHLSDVDIAAITNYLRHVFNNFSGVTTPELVAGQRNPGA